ncbi:MAG: S8 family peptidase [Prevotellaceae bacterium]|nr:S8 family peptidase [Candidatus Faecinaster equi]
MANHKHFRIGDECKVNHDFEPVPRPASIVEPCRDNHIAHGDFLLGKYEDVIREFDEQWEARQKVNKPIASGYYIDIELTDSNVKEEKLSSKTGAKLMAITPSPIEENPNRLLATVYLSKEHKEWLPSRINDYKTIQTKTGPRNHDLINRIESVTRSRFLGLFNPEEVDEVQRKDIHVEYFFELWTDDLAMFAESNRQSLAQLGITIVKGPLHLTNTFVYLIKATIEQLHDIYYALDLVRELHLYRQPSVLVDSDSIGQDEWGRIIKDNTIDATTEYSVKVALLDSGVNNGHILLADYIDDADCCSAISLLSADGDGHGTGMSGLALYGDLADLIEGQGVAVDHKIVSVKILPSQEGELNNPPELYGAITENAVEIARQKGANLCCMAVTETDGFCAGEATSWSAAVDETLYHDGECDTLMLIAAGNVYSDDIITDYHEICKVHPILSPAQAVNAITVGAYTNKVMLNDGKYMPMATVRGDLSPYSRTSFPWKQNRIKPDIVMEGGNKGKHQLLKALTGLTDLSLVTTSKDFPDQLFAKFCATSAATALATKMAADIQTYNPEYSPLTIRALLIHSARWTPQMESFSIDERLSMFGYGVPNLDRAKASQETNATFVYEGELIPYKDNGLGGAIYNEMHHFSLPWPSDVLLELGDMQVRLRVTLSYYIQPAPGRKNYKSLFKYSSVGLSFDVKQPTESSDSLIARHNHQEPSLFKAKNQSDRWAIRQTRRERSTVQSDWIDMTATELAECGELVVYPTAGWWKKEKLENIANKIKYSLVVSIETPTQDVNIYSAVAQKIVVQV